MAARFKWQEEKETGDLPWQVDGTSAMRKVNREVFRAARRRRLLRWFFILLFFLGLLSTVFLWEYEESFRAPGTFEPYLVTREQVKAPLSGTIIELGAGEGETVAEGDLLAVIWPDELDVVRDAENRELDYELTLDEIDKIEEMIGTLEKSINRLAEEKSAYAADESEIVALEHRLVSAAEKLRRLEDETERARVLYEREVISRVEYENFTSEREVALSGLKSLSAEIAALRSRRALEIKRMRRQIEELRGRHAEGKITLAQKEKEKQQQKAMLESALERAAKTSVHAPWCGLIVRQEKVAGERVVSGETVFFLASGNRRQVSLRVNPENYHRLQMGQEALIFSRAVPEPRKVAARGRVSYIGSYARAREGEHHVPATVDIDHLEAEIPLGTTVDVRLLMPGSRTFLELPRWPGSRKGENKRLEQGRVEKEI